MCKENSLNFVDKIVGKDFDEDICNEIHTRFPPEPNGYLHIGSAYAINISYSIARKYKGKFNLRFDDTNPGKEDIEYVNAIKEDMKWLGFDYGEKEYYGSDYFQKIYLYAIYLIKKGRAYVCDLSPEKIKEYRGTLTKPGINSPYRERSVEENLKLFQEMKEGIHREGDKVLRAKIDMNSGNINMRDPVIYRISYKEHYKTKEKWCIYPMYDFAHPIQDYIEGITHSLCSIEFKDHRPLYNWVLENLDLERRLPKQIEFGRMNLSGVVTSKRYLKELVEKKLVDGWDDPRLPTIKGLRRRGYTRESILSFLDDIGISKSESTVDVNMLESSLRNDLKAVVPVVMAVLNPLKVVITNIPEDYFEELEIVNNKENPSLGKRKVVFSRTIYIEKEDFMENPPKKYNRLVLGGEVRLYGGYFIRCNEVIKDIYGDIKEIRCTYDPETKSGTGFTGRKVKGTIHWISEKNFISCKVNLYDSLFLEKPIGGLLEKSINKDSLVIKDNALIEKSILEIEGRVQFMRHGYFIRDKDNKLVFNRIVSLKKSYR
ncbi:glutamine--tRNA ligase/YqeY domain fusion protein [uncultured Clostridium sp.]|uniref:glutamine--tRNA ligase/YqeY domain fusion protein n=1 Tax=uncultured Clostridium sp. TaxID=59620 RepID=UPI0025CD4BE2|nr:glutamine--tRNA ligase/YqeY domain fusion protein [uncultured Clostridium sp.]